MIKGQSSAARGRDGFHDRSGADLLRALDDDPFTIRQPVENFHFPRAASSAAHFAAFDHIALAHHEHELLAALRHNGLLGDCLLYTSDAADE